MTRYLILVPLIACIVSPAAAQSVGSQPDASSVRQAAPQQTVIGDYLSLGIDGPRGREFLFGYTGMPVYTYSRDKGAQPTCYDECAVRWPPYIVGAHDDLGPKQGVEGKVGTTKRSDGNLSLRTTAVRFISTQRIKRASPPRATESTAFGTWSGHSASVQRRNNSEQTSKT
jgi:hypothetical protein